MVNIAAISYGAAALGFLILSLVLLVSWRGRLNGAALVTAAVLTFIWAVAAAARQPAAGYPATLTVPLLELLRDTAWFVFLFLAMWPGLGLRGLYANGKMSLVAGVIAAVSLGMFGLLIYSAVGESAVRLQSGLDVRIPGHVLLSLTGLVLVEQLFRNTLPERRWAIKYLCIAVGGMFAYDFILYSDALFIKHINEPWWNARGLIDALVVPLIAVSAARNPEWSLDVYVSRSIVFHSTTLLGAGVYLLVMATSGHYIRLYGGDWGEFIQAVFFFSGFLLLLIILFSAQVRAQLKVFLNKHFFNYKYDYREEWLRFIRTLSSVEPNTQLRELTIRALAEIVDSPGGVLWFRNDAGGYDNVAHWGIPPVTGSTESGDGSLARFLEATEWIIISDEYRQTPERYVGLTMPEWLMQLPRAWLVVPLMQHERLLGFIVLTRARAPRDIDWEDCDLLKTAGRQVASYLAQLQVTEALFDAKQFESFNRFSAYVVHDLKNLIAQLTLVVSNATKHKNNPQFMQDAIHTVEHCVQKMNYLLSQLRVGRDSGAVAAESVVNLVAILQETVTGKQIQQPAPTFTCEHDELLVRADPVRCATVIGHVIQNAQEATAPDGGVGVSLYGGSNQVVIEVKDTGCGMDNQFIRNRLFRPFDSTKGKGGMGIGAYETREWARAHGGEVEVESQPGKGTIFRIRLPRVMEELVRQPAASDKAKTAVQ